MYNLVSLIQMCNEKGKYFLQIILFTDQFRYQKRKIIDLCRNHKVFLKAFKSIYVVTFSVIILRRIV
jgi:hypothetical protein